MNPATIIGREAELATITRHIEALRNSSVHKLTHSTYVAFVTSFGVTESKHRSHINDIVALDSLFQ